MSDSDSTGYRSPRTLSKWTSIALQGVIGVNIAYFLLPHAVDENAKIGNLLALANLTIYGIYAVIAMVSYLVATVGFVLWMVRVHKNLDFLGVQDLSSKTRQCVWGFFIPILNLYKPYMILQELWKASNPDTTAGEWRASDRSKIIVGWWILWILRFALLFVFVILIGWTMSEQLDQIYNYIRAAFEIVTAVFAILLVQKLTLRQEEKHSRGLQGSQKTSTS